MKDEITDLLEDIDIFAHQWCYHKTQEDQYNLQEAQAKLIDYINPNKDQDPRIINGHIYRALAEYVNEVSVSLDKEALSKKAMPHPRLDLAYQKLEQVCRLIKR